MRTLIFSTSGWGLHLHHYFVLWPTTGVAAIFWDERSEPRVELFSYKGELKSSKIFQIIRVAKGIRILLSTLARLPAGAIVRVFFFRDQSTKKFNGPKNMTKTKAEQIRRLMPSELMVGFRNWGSYKLPKCTAETVTLFTKPSHKIHGWLLHVYDKFTQMMSAERNWCSFAFRSDGILWAYVPLHTRICPDIPSMNLLV